MLSKALVLRKIFLSFVILLVLFGSVPGQAYDNSLVSLTNPYKKALRKYTKVGKVYSLTQLDTKYKWYATYHSPEYLAAFEKLFHELYPEGQTGLAEELKNKMFSPNQTQFFIALYARDRGLKRMIGDKNLWSISLIVGNEVIKPLLVERVFLTPYQYRFYPYLGKWYHGYRVIFPYDAENNPPKEMILQLSSVAGSSQVKFKK